jgi:hypothetical protein
VPHRLKDVGNCVQDIRVIGETFALIRWATSWRIEKRLSRSCESFSNSPTR